MASTNSNEPDRTLINELYDAIEQQPPAIEARRMLMQHFTFCGWSEAAVGIALELLMHTPGDTEAISIVKASEQQQNKTLPSQSTSQSSSDVFSTQLPIILPKITDWDTAMSDLTIGVKMLVARAKTLREDAETLFKLQEQKNSNNMLALIDALLQGHLNASAVKLRRPEGARSVAWRIQSSADRAMDIASTDFKTMVQWLRLQELDDDSVRDEIVKRRKAIEDALPPQLQSQVGLAMMHTEREDLKRKYVNDETMLGDTICDVPRSNFWASEDNYAWDMEELAAAITAANGVMRNPLSRDMFSAKDIRAILEHPHGKSLAVLHVAQEKLSQGVRPKTISAIDELAKMLLEDRSIDQIPSHKAMEEFLAYVVTLPQPEQDSLEKLQIPAKESQNGRAFDTTILESVHDAKGNRTCTHKTGDFLKQAARYLRQKK